MKAIRTFYFTIACSMLFAACASVKEVGPAARPVSGEPSVANGTNPGLEAKPMSCKGCKAATDNLKSARAAAQEALLTEDSEKLKAALQMADAEMAKMEGHKEKCMAMMEKAGKTDSATAIPLPADGGHAKHH